MNQRRHVTLVAAAATLLATAPMSTIFASWTWLIDCILAIAVVCGAALLLRSVRAPVWAQVLGMVVGVCLIATLLFGEHAYLGLIPSGRTLQHFADLVSAAGTDIRDQAVPVPDRDGLLFLTTVGIGGVAVLVDLFAVGLRQPALAGMPMLPLYSIPVIVHQDSVSVVPFVIGSIGYLWLLASDNVDRVRRFGRRFTGDGRDVDLWEPSPLAAAGRRLGVVGVALAILLPLAIPGMTSGLLDRVGGGGSGIGTGGGNGNGSGSVDLFARLSGSLNQGNPFTMIKVSTNDPDPYYLRFGVADQLTPAGFRNRVSSGGDPAVDNNFPDPTVTLPGVTQSTYNSHVQFVKFDMGLLPLYPDVTRTSQIDRAWRYDAAGQLIYSSSNRVTTADMKSYDFEYVHTRYSPDALRQAPPLEPDNPVTNLSAVPSQPFVKALVDKLTNGKINEYDEVRALFDYFSLKNHFVYELSTKTGSSGSDIENFLNNRAGYCEQYAAALAWMVRQAGFPARVAFGFTLGTGSNGGTYTLTNKNLHAWTEVYFPGYGWVPFDATPTSGLSGPVSTTWAPDPNRPATSTSTAPGQVPDVGASGGAGAGDRANDPAQGRDPGGAAIQSQSRLSDWAFGGLGVLLVLLVLPAATRTALRRRRRPRYATQRSPHPEVTGGQSAPVMRVLPGPEADRARRDAHAAWDELLDTLLDYRVGVDDAETPRLTVDRLVAEFGLTGETADAVELLGRAEEHARYARGPLREPGLGVALRALRRAIARRVPGRTRLVAALFPPSVLHRWRAGLIDSFAGAVAWTGRVREGMVSSLRPRRARAQATRS
ncbi:MAG: transglutaminase domain-containing protein [Micromonosporaceae bacterium]|nr:transglutaminase domain-containing protein [Micromonosporaceae bacterium]